MSNEDSWPPLHIHQVLLHSGRYEIDGKGKPKLRYTAIDPMNSYVQCNCGRRDCWTADLRPLREHMNALMQCISSCGLNDLIEGGQQPWPGTLFSLHMAVSIEDVFVDPAYVDESGAGLFCRPAWEFDEKQREHSSKYVAALSIFNFTWMAYEAAIESALGASYSNDKLPVQVRNFFKNAEMHYENHLPAFESSHRFTSQICRRFTGVRDDIARITTKYGLSGAAAAAELVRIFRNHIVHGKDSTPLSGGSTMVVHFYATTRLLLMLIQLLLLHAVKQKDANIPLSLIFDDKGKLPARHVLLNLHRPEVRWTA